LQTPQPTDGRSFVRQVVVTWPTSEWLRKWLIRLVVAIVVIYLAYVVRDIWVPLLLAFLIATVLDPIVDRLELRGWSRAVAATLIYSVFIVGLVAAIAFAYPHVLDQATEIQKGLAERFPDTSPHGLRKSLQADGVSRSLSDFLVKVYQGTVGTFQSSNRMAEYGLNVVTNLIWLVIIPIISYYALRDYHLILAKGLLLVPKEKRDLIQTAVAETTGIFGKYLRGMAIVSLLNGLATWLLLTIFQIPSALLIAILATILYNVPYLGAIAINVLTAAVAFLHGGVHELYVVTGIGLVMHHVVFDQIISPRILGGQVGLHPILSIVALLVGNLLLGVVGMILAMPIAACIQIGVLALVPKLSHEIDIPKDSENPEDDDTVAELEQETLEAHTKADATEELHRSVNTAVDNIEEKIQEEKIQEEKIQANLEEQNSAEAKSGE
jgi:predicted PurR-regulated permease PerM